MGKKSNKAALKIARKWQSRAEYLARSNPGRSVGWIADQIAREDIGAGFTSHDIKRNIKLSGYI